jgi:GNAT superfamily N-acetyltransferase
MGQPWTAREITESDAAAIARHRYFRGESRADSEAYTAWLTARIRGGEYVGFVAEASGQIIGGAGAVLLDWGPTRGDSSSTRARVANVFTEESMRGQGVARRLLQEVLSACRARGIRTVCLAASLDARGLYEAMGFEPYAEEMILRRGQD